MTRPEVWPNASAEEFDRVEEAVRRLSAVRDLAGYWTPIGKVVESLVYATEPGESERAVVEAVLESAPKP